MVINTIDTDVLESSVLKALDTASGVATSATSANTANTITLPAVSGIIETNSTFVNFCIMEDTGWGAKTAASTAKRMLITIEDTGSDTQVNIFDLAAESFTGATALKTLTISGAATPTDVAAIDGHIGVAHEDGVTFFDTSSGDWAENTEGAFKTLTTSTTPALHDNDVIGIDAGYLLDGVTPAFGIIYGTGTKGGSVIKADGTLYDMTMGGSVATGVMVHGGHMFFNYDTTQFRASLPIEQITADTTVNPPHLIAYGDNTPFNLSADADTMSGAGDKFALGGPDGFGLNVGVGYSTRKISGEGAAGVNAGISTTVNTGFYTFSVKGIWLSDVGDITADVSPKATTLTHNGSLTFAAVETGAELFGASGFSSSNNLTRASDADWDVVGTGALYMSIWFKTSGNSAPEQYLAFENSGNTIEFDIKIRADGTVQGIDRGASGLGAPISSVVCDDGVWHKLDFVRVSSTERYLYVDGVLEASNTTNAGSLSDSGNLPLAIGSDADGSTDPATSTTLSLAHLSATAPTAAEILQMYEAEKGMFVANAKCLLQGAADAVLDVSINPHTGDVLVTQADKQTKFRGLVVLEERTIATGGTTFEHGLLFGENNDVVEINDANLYATTASKNIRGTIADVEYLKKVVAPGIDMSKAAAWVIFDGTGTISISASYNIESITDNATGNYTVYTARGFNSLNYYTVGGASREGSVANMCDFTTTTADGSNGGRNNKKQVLTKRLTDNAGIDASQVLVVFYGELSGD
jgi:hypothetical protein